MIEILFLISCVFEGNRQNVKNKLTELFVHAMVLPAVDQLERYQWNRGKKHVTATPLNGRTTLTEL